MPPQSIWQLLWRAIWPRRYIAPPSAARAARLSAQRKLRQTERDVAEVRDEFGRRMNAAWRKDP